MGHALHLLLCHLLVGGLGVALLWGLHRLPIWLVSPDGLGLAESLATPLLVVRILLEVIAWPVLGLMLLFGPIIVVEDCSCFSALREWWRLLRQHLGRVLLYEALAVAVGLVVTAPFLGPVLLTWWLNAAEQGVFGLVSQSAVLVVGVHVGTFVFCHVFLSRLLCEPRSRNRRRVRCRGSGRPWRCAG